MDVKKTKYFLNLRAARKLWGPLEHSLLQPLRNLSEGQEFEICCGDLLLINQHWYVTHTGLVRLGVRLPPDAYRQLHRQVLQRDGWRCQVCGTMSNLEVHHQRFRSHAGADSEQNLITLCSECHADIHRSSGSHEKDTR